MGRYGFSIQLFPGWRDMVSVAALTQANVNTAICNMGRSWLDRCGYDAMYDPDRSFMDEWENILGKPIKLGPRARKLYEPCHIHVQWGEWGPHHITIPGDACGLDIAAERLWRPTGGKALYTHNIDNANQVILLLSIFTFFAETLIYAYEDFPGH